MTKETVRQFSTRLQQWLASRTAFLAIIGVFLINSVWLAFTAIYPLPFDEYYHFGIIKIYAQQWSPFITTQPAEASLYGDITRYPSYLYHYLMSFPYRLLEQFVASEESQIIILRLLNIALFVVGMVLFRKLLDRAGVSRRITHAALLFFAITPIVPFLAAHINYDNVLVIITPLALLFGYQVLRSKKVAVHETMYLLLTGLFGCLLKETFLPIFGVIFLYVAIALGWRHRQKLLPELWRGFRKQAGKWQIVVSIVLALGLGLFGERYIQNQLVYGNYGPECDKVQSIEVCSDYMPWYRNYQNQLNKPADPLFGNPASFTQHWASKIMRGFYAIFSHTPTNVISSTEPFGPIVLKSLLPIPIVLGSMMAIASALVIAFNFKRLWKQSFYRYGLIVIAGYTFIVWMFNYTSYLQLGAAQAIQARYFLPLLPIALVIALQSFAWFVRSNNMRMVLLISVGSLYIYGGGAVGWLLRADSNWYWQKSQVIQINQQLQNTLKKTIIH